MVFLRVTLFLSLLFFVQCFQTSHFENNQLSEIEQSVIENGGVTPSKDKTENLRFVAMWQNEGKRQDFIENLCQEFRILHQDIDLQMTYQEKIPEIKNNVENHRVKNMARFISNQIQSHNIEWEIVPMLSGAYYDEVGNFLDDSSWGRQHLVDFKNISGFYETQNAAVVQDPTFSEPFDDIILGPYLEGWYHVMYYNNDLANQMKLRINTFDMTSDELISIVRQIYQFNQENGTNYSAFFDSGDWITLGILYEHLIKSGIDFSKDNQLDKTFTQEYKEVFLKTLKLFEELGKYDPLISSASQNQWSTSQNLVLENQAIFYINGTWMYNIWEEIDHVAVDKMLPCELPTFQPIKFYPGMFQNNFAVLKNAPGRDNAVKFMMFLASKDVAEDWVQSAKSPTGIKRHFSKSTIGQDKHEQFITKMSQKYGGSIADINLNLFGDKAKIEFDYQDLHKLMRREATADEIYTKYLTHLREI